MRGVTYRKQPLLSDICSSIRRITIIVISLGLACLLYTQLRQIQVYRGCRRGDSCWESKDTSEILHGGDTALLKYLDDEKLQWSNSESNTRSPDRSKCHTRHKWTECSVKFTVGISDISKRQVTILLNKQRLESFDAVGILLVKLNNKCHLVDTHRFTKIKTAVEFYNSLSEGTLLVGFAIASLGSIIHDTFGQTKVGDDEPANSNIYPFVVKKEYDGLGNHSVIAADGHPSSWSMDIFLGVPYPVSTKEEEYSALIEKYRGYNIRSGGYYTPTNCKAINKIAIIVPYRNRDIHLRFFLDHMIGFLSKQQAVDFSIVIIEQTEPAIFNRAALMNVGYLEAKKLAPFDCYSFHDVDLLPQDLTNSYTCNTKTRHLVLGRDLHKYRLRYPEYFGGAIMMTPAAIEKINGFCNKFYGWGGEDDNTYLRVKEAGLSIARYPASVATYVMLAHDRDPGNPRSGRKSPFGLVNTGIKNKKPESAALGYEDIWQHSMRSAADGLSTVNYTVVGIEERKLYTHIYVKLENDPQLNKTSAD